MKIIKFFLISVALIFTTEVKAQYSYTKLENLFELRYTPISGSKGILMTINVGDSGYEYAQAEVYKQLIQCSYHKQISDALAKALPVELRQSMKKMKIFLSFKIDILGSIYDMRLISKENFQHIVSEEWLNMMYDVLQSIEVSFVLDETIIESYIRDRVGLFWVNYTFPPYHWK